MNEVEAVARAIEDQLTVEDGWEVGTTALRNMCIDFAQASIAALDAARGDAEPVAWMPIETAPKDGTAFQAIIPGHGADNVLCWTDGLIGSDGRDCGSWAFASDQEPPDCWTDGYCWEVNEDGVPSVQPTHWKPLHLPRGDQVARVEALSDNAELLTIAWMDGSHRSTKAHRARIAKLEAEVARLREALVATEGAIAEYYRYWTGGEMRGSYDGKPERASLWKSRQTARTALGASHD